MKRVLVTGGTGFLGRHCVPLLHESRYEIHIISKSASKSPVQPGIKIHSANLFDELEIRSIVKDVQPQFLLHLAWNTSAPDYWNSDDNLRWVESSIGLIRSFSDFGGSRAVIAGTCAEYNWNHRFCAEDITPLKGESLYGVSKHALHLLLEKFAVNRKFSYAWGRIFFMYGPHEPSSRLVSATIRNLRACQTAVCHNSTLVRDFIYVQDVADIMTQLLDNPFCGVVNIGTGVPVSIGDVVLEIGQILNKKKYINLDGSADLTQLKYPFVVADVNRLNSVVPRVEMLNIHRGLKRMIDLSIERD